MTNDYIEIICIKEYNNRLNNFIFIKGNTYKVKFKSDYAGTVASIFTIDEKLIMTRTIASIEPFKRFQFYEYFLERDKWRDNQIDIILNSKQ